ncbi:MAG: 1-acyl-sn-glycerol-3-phosphate acyltransferase [Spirochaetales bacterium]|nr:1-acyl-sn-glycerol-3-phosphate acyltransferase [Spirochaetales bacterium]
MHLILSLAYWIIAVPAIVLVMFPLSLFVWLATVLFDRRLRALQFIANIWGSLFIWLNPFVSVEIIGKGNIDPEKTYIITPNHSFLLDIPALHHLFIHFKWISKDSIRKIPFIGWNMVLNKTIFINRTDQKSQLKMMRSCEENLSIGNSIMIFPEGTRSRGLVLGKFLDGGFLLAKKMKCPILPVALTYSEHKILKGITFTSFLKIKVEVLSAISSEEFKKTRDLRDHVKMRIEEALQLQNRASSPS